MKAATLCSSYRSIAGLAAAGAVLLCAAGASAQTSSPYYSFGVANITATPTFNAAFPVYDSLTFTNLQINEIFTNASGDNFVQKIVLGALQTGDIEQSSAFIFSQAGGAFSDPIHGILTAAVLTGNLKFPGINATNPLQVTIQPTSDPSSQYQQLINEKFSASLFGPAQSGINLGTFSLLDSGNSPVETVNIEAAPVPEASTTVSLGLLLALGLGSLAVARRKRGVSAAN